MDEDIEVAFQKQTEALPSEIREYIISDALENEIVSIIQSFNLSEETRNILRREIILALTGLVPFHLFRGEFANEINDLDDATIDAISSKVLNALVGPVQPALEKFLQEQDAVLNGEVQKEKEKITIPAPPSLIEPQKVWVKTPATVPENLPTAEELPPIAPPVEIKNSPTYTPPPSPQTQNDVVGMSGLVHPFEEKMKKVFTGGVVDRGGLVLDKKSTPTESAPLSTAFNKPPHDPYREPIE